MVVLHVIAVALLASYRTGVKVAVWHSLLLLVVFYARQGYAVVTLSARGFGRSCGTPASRSDGCERGWTHIADQQPSQIAESGPQPPFGFGECRARLDEFGLCCRELGLLRSELLRNPGLTRAGGPNLPEQCVDGRVLLRELGADRFLLRADRVERIALGTGAGAGRERRGQTAQNDGHRDEKSAAGRGLRHPATVDGTRPSVSVR